MDSKIKRAALAAEDAMMRHPGLSLRIVAYAEDVRVIGSIDRRLGSVSDYSRMATWAEIEDAKFDILIDNIDKVATRLTSKAE